ncbi:MAG: prohibitin family protein [Actinomycetota bacterium]|nr:prohibitin family protein [Actinomycetota bacterium]
MVFRDGKEIKMEGKVMKLVPKIIVGAVIGIVVLILALNTFVIVQAGNVRVLTQFGKTTGVTYTPGLNVKIPFIQNTVNYSTRQVTYETSDNPETSRAAYPDYSVDTTSSDGQQIQLKYTIRFAADGKKAEWIYNNIGNMDNVVEKVVKTEARSLSRNIPKKYSAAQLYSEQVFDVQQEIGDTLKPIFEDNGIILDEFLLRKIDFTEEYFSVLEEKQIAEERIVVEQNVLEQEKIKKEQTIIKAEAEAREIEIRGKALESYPQIIQLEFIQKLSPNISWGILPEEGIVPFIDLSNLQEEMGSNGQNSAQEETGKTQETEETTTEE